MEENRNNTTATAEEEGGIDIMALLRGLWDGRKTIFICLGIFIVLGLVAALSMKRTYSVTTVMVPQMGDAKSGLGGLAALAGFDMGAASNNGELSPLIYPQIVSSVPFRLEMMHTPLHYQKCDTLISMFDYAKAKYEKPSVFSYVMKYTIGLPGVILGSLSSKPKEVTLPGGNGTDDGTPKPVVVSMDEYKMLQGMGQVISLDVDKKEGYITMHVNGSEPIQTAELALKAQQLLQDEVTRFRTEKSQSELEYIQARYDEAKAEAERYQMALAGSRDRMQNVITSSSTVGKERLQSKFNVANTVYLEMAKQLEQAKMKVKKDTPAFSIIEPVTLPMKPSNSRAKTLIIWVFLGVVVGCGIVLVKGYWPKLKEKFQKPETEE
jgi:LPS O-antigen subunit length determinant protein (WzzB/FepE family)